MKLSPGGGEKCEGMAECDLLTTPSNMWNYHQVEKNVRTKGSMRPAQSVLWHVWNHHQVGQKCEGTAERGLLKAPSGM
jgi:rRNA pseudouridine-1189 N-methylase Emg1 (Nep1/Mra1 family)